MHYVYLIESISFPGERYVGLSSDIKAHIAEHNAGKATYTRAFKPWRLVTYVAFSELPKAKAFELYLKSGSGHAFAKKRLGRANG